MKTDYAALGSRSLERLRVTCEHADDVQRDLLFDLLDKNKNTNFGEKFHFSNIKSTADFQNKIPLSDYEDYADEIKQMIDGKKNILTADEPVYFCISSGTTGEEKYLPLTEADLRLQYSYAYGMIFGQVREYYKDIDESDIFGQIFQIGEFAKTYMPDGRMKGIRSGCVYQWLDRDEGFDTSDYCVPKEILFPNTLEDFLYMKIRFALAQRELTAIHGVFINRVAGAMDYVYQNFGMLLRDMELGTVDQSVNLSAKWRRWMEEKLPANPTRANEIRKIANSGQKRGMVKKIWKNMKYILAIGGEAFSYYTDKMLEYADGIPIHHYAYAASEGVFGVAEKMNVADRYILFPEAVFFEFIPIQDTKKILLIQEISVGEKYEIVCTNRSGLYRYRLGDVIEVVGWYKKAPVVKYCYRRNQVINIAGEKTNCVQLSAAVKCFSKITNIEVIEYCVGEDVSQIAPRYLVYMECANNNVVDDADEILEKCMRDANFEYRSCADMNEILPLRVAFLRSGSFQKYEHKMAESGKLMGQYKLPRFLDTEEKKQFFEAQIIK